MKRSLSILLIVCFLTTFLSAKVIAAGEPLPELSTPDYTTADMAKLPTVSNLEYEFPSAGEKWKNIAAHDPPASFKQVSYELADRVIVLKNTISDQIASAGQLISGSPIQAKSPEKIIRDGGYINRNALDSALLQSNETAKPGMIVVDTQAGTSFKISASTAFSTDYGTPNLDKQAEALKNTYMIEQPQINEVFKDFSIGGDAVSLTRGNINGFADNVEACVVPDSTLKAMSFGDSLKDYKYLTGDKLINLQFTDTKLTAMGNEGKQLTVKLSGGLGISNIEVDAKYSAFHGYHLIINVAEEFYLVAEVQGTIQEEVRIPLFGIDIPFGIGRVSGGLFLIMGVDGDIRIEAEAREYASATMGVRGKTFFGAPVSAKGIFDKEFHKDGDVDIAGRINGYVKVGPLLDISILGLDLIGAGAFAGVGLEVEKKGEMLDINLYASLQIYIKIIGKTLNLINWTPSLLHKRQQDTGGYRVHIEEAYIEVGRVGGYIEDMHSSSSEATRVPANINYRILVYPKGIDPQTAAESDLRIYPDSGWQQTSDEGEFFYEEPETMLKKGDLVAVQFMIGNDIFKSDPVEALFPYTTVTISEADYFNDFVTGNVAPIKVINYGAQQVAKPGDPADPPEEQYKWEYYTGPLSLQGLNGRMLTVNAHNPVNQELMKNEVYMPFGQGGIVTVMTDEYGNFDSRNPQMLPEGQYTPIFNGELQIRPGAVVLGNGKFDYSKNKNISAVKASFNVLGCTNAYTILINPIHPLSVSRVLSFIEGSDISYKEGNKIVNQMQFNETIHIINGGGTRAITQQEVLEFFEEGWTTQDIADYEGGRFWGSEGEASVLRPTVSRGHFTVTPVLDDNGDLTSSVTVSNRVIVEWVWQEHPLPTEITSADHAAVSAGGSFQAEGKGIKPLIWSLSGAPKEITINPSTGRITVPDNISAQDYTFTVRLEQDPEHFKTELLKVPPMSNASFCFRHTKSSLQTIADFYKYNMGNPAMGGDPPVNYIGHYPAPPAEQVFTLTVKKPSELARTAPDIVSAEHGYRFAMTSGSENLNVEISAAGSTPITWSVMSTNGRLIPSEISIDAQSGRLTVLKNIPSGIYYFSVKAENSVGNDTQNCVLTVAAPSLSSEPMRTAPDIAVAEHGYRFAMTSGSENLDVKISAAGSTPITWSVMSTNGRPIPSEISIDAQSGRLTVLKNIPSGIYYFSVKAENSAGNDTQSCVLSVTQARTAPTIAEKEHGYAFTKIVGGGDLTVPIAVSGSEPISWSLEQKNNRYIIPEEVTIDPDTGVITVKEGIDPGTYYFVVRAENDVGFDLQECTLKVIALQIPRLPLRPHLFLPYGNAAQAISLVTASGAVIPPITQIPPTNSTTIRVDHIRDRYTYDRNYVNGAEFIRWNSIFKLNIEGSPEEVVFSPNAPICDSYHIYIDMTDPELQNIITNMGKRIQDIKNAKDNLGKYLLNETGQYVTNPWNEGKSQFPGLQVQFAPFDSTGQEYLIESTLLDYTATLKEIQSGKGGVHSVQLGGINGSSVADLFFHALAQNSSASIKFQQEGAVITFQGDDVKGAAEDAMYDFGFLPMAEHEEQIRSVLANGKDAFTYSFLGHGKLPGVATFDITTDISEGTKVNVYNYDAASNQFSLIARDLTVGDGRIVTYKNNTMSEYVITTETIKSAQSSDTVSRQNLSTDNSWLKVVIICLAAGILIAIFVFLRRRKWTERI